MSDPALTSHQREFHCVHCSGKILIPRDLPPTTGPCPHCGGIITSPPQYTDLPPAPTGAGSPTPAAPAYQPIQPIPVAAALPASPSPQPPRETPPSSENTPASPAQYAPPAPHPSDFRETPPQPETEISRQPVAAPHTETPASAPLPEKESAPPANKAGMVAIILGILLLLLTLFATGYYLVFKEMRHKPAQSDVAVTPQKSATSEAHYLRIGWQKEAREVLEKFLAGTSVETKLPYVIPSPDLREKMEIFYGGAEINDSDTPASTYSFTELPEGDKKRGIFMMVYNLPPQFEMKEYFRPLAPIEVQYGMDDADILLTAVAQVKNFATEPLLIQAFFKRTPDGLKLDWETFVQTKYRTFQNFITLPEIGLKATFRVIVLEDVPDSGRAETGYRTYRLIDCANQSDSQRIRVAVDSDVGRSLSPLNWRGTENARPTMKTATVELQWAGEPNAPQLTISRFICWEFLGLGGEEANNPQPPQ
ncbi:MAG: hypothetical protein QM627_03475 [Luteolibacter sp.]